MVVIKKEFAKGGKIFKTTASVVPYVRMVRKAPVKENYLTYRTVNRNFYHLDLCHLNSVPRNLSPELCPKTFVTVIRLALERTIRAYVTSQNRWEKTISRTRGLY